MMGSRSMDKVCLTDRRFLRKFWNHEDRGMKISRYLSSVFNGWRTIGIIIFSSRSDGRGIAGKMVNIK